MAAAMALGARANDFSENVGKRCKNNGFYYRLGDNIIKIIGKRCKTNRKRNYLYYPLGDNIMGHLWETLENLVKTNGFLQAII